MREIRVAKTAGFCFGVRRAVQMAEEAAEKSDSCVTLGPIIHNRSVVDMLRDKGVFEISEASEATEGDTVIIRSHGVGKSEYDMLGEKGADIVDATCPYVSKIHKIVMNAGSAGRLPVIIGEKEHPEVRAIHAWCRDSLIFETSDELYQWLKSSDNSKKAITAVFQTTGNRENMVNCSEIIKKECTSSEIFDTICNATSKRQEEAASLSAECDAMIVIGGKNSANSLRLSEICSERCKKVFFVESAEEVNTSDFDGDDIIGIIAGASTPEWIIKEVYKKMSNEIKSTEIREDAADINMVSDASDASETQQVTEGKAAPVTVDEAAQVTEGEVAPEKAEDAEKAEQESVAAEEESFAELLEKSIKTLHTGEKVKGIVAAISPTEVSVDLGTKQSGYIPISELTDDLDARPEDIIQIGSEVETYVMRVNDVEGTVMLSKKRLDTVKNWDEIEKARVERTVLEGIITEENKGGVVASVKGVRVFIPASQTGLGKDQPFSTLLRQRVKLRITEVNQSRRRVVGSIRMVRSEERKNLAQKTWSDIEEGKRYKGVVKSVTSYGAFVDIGGVDGMVHVSELSWSRVKSPADVLSVGDEVEVYVISFNREKGKISLGYKDPGANPWKLFTDKYQIGSIAKVKIVKLMPFGAFAEIVPGVDGLIHISQIADHRIGRPDEFLSVGQEIEVKIIDIDYEKNNVSLSIRALIEPELAPEQVQSGEAVSETIGESAVVYDTDVNKPTFQEEEETSQDVTE